MFVRMVEKVRQLAPKLDGPSCYCILFWKEDKRSEFDSETHIGCNRGKLSVQKAKISIFFNKNKFTIRYCWNCLLPSLPFVLSSFSFFKKVTSGYSHSYYFRCMYCVFGILESILNYFPINFDGTLINNHKCYDLFND